MWYKSGCPPWLELFEMDPEQFSVYRHEAVHELMRLNELCEQEFRIS